MIAPLAAAAGLLLTLSLGCRGCAPDRTPRAVRVAAVDAADLVRLDSGERLRLSGVEEAAHPLASGDSIAAARARIAQDLVGKMLFLKPDAPRPIDSAELRGELWDNGMSVNARILERGDGLLDLTRGASEGDGRYLAAATAASAARSRRAQVPLGFQAGIVLPLYSKEKEHDYGPRLREIKAAGAQWVSLLFVWMVEKMDGHEIVPKRGQPHWEDNRSPPDEHLIATIREAKRLGLRVLLLPIVLPWKPGPDDWRGNLRPSNRDAFFESYARFVLRHADLAESLGVDAYSIGSELISLESNKPGDVDWWRRIARSARHRFGGRLTYSANWDHYEEVGIWDELDFVGMTAYYSLTKDPEANVEAMVEAWRPAQEKLAAFGEKVKRPIVFTEIGYASIRGINTDPWNYKMETPLDLAVQERCYRAFAKAFAKPDFLGGAYFFDWYDDGGANDKSYTPRGKPAESVMKQFLADAAKLPPPKHDPARAENGAK